MSKQPRVLTSESQLLVVIPPAAANLLPSQLDNMPRVRPLDAQEPEVEVTMVHDHQMCAENARASRDKYTLTVRLSRTLRWSIAAILASIGVWKLRDFISGLQAVFAGLSPGFW